MNIAPRWQAAWWRCSGDFDELLGAGRYHFARSQDKIVLGVGEARMGREFYPFLLPLLALILGLEQLLANRFCRRGE